MKMSGPRRRLTSAMSARRRSITAVLAAATFVVGVAVTPAGAEGGNEGGAQAPPANLAPVQGHAKSCRMYGSASGFGLACAAPSGGLSLLELLKRNPIPPCWDTAVPAGFTPPRIEAGPGQWWVHTCMTGLDVANPNPHAVTMSFEFRFLTPGLERLLTPAEQATVLRFSGDRQIPFPLLETTPTASPRVGQDLSFSLLNEHDTPSLTTGGVTMYAQVVHLQVRPLGDRGPAVDCDGPGQPLTAEALAAAVEGDPSICRYTYLRSSDQAGGGVGGNRYPAHVTAFWTIFYDDGTGPVAFGTFRKESVNQIRVTEVQTLVVS